MIRRAFLKKLLDSLDGEKRIGLEATGYYGDTLKLFSEFKPFFKGKFSATALYILVHYQTAERIANMRTLALMTHCKGFLVEDLL